MNDPALVRIFHRIGNLLGVAQRGLGSALNPLDHIPNCWKALPDSNRHSELRRLWS